MSADQLLVIAATEGELRGVPEAVPQLVCGVGPVDAGIATARALATGTVRAVLHLGIAGARADSGIAIGDVVVATSSVYCDSQSRFVQRTAQPSVDLIDVICSTVPSARRCVIGTSADVGGSLTHTELAVEAMEGFAVARAAELAGVPAVEVRVISNMINEPDRAKWEFDRALTILADIAPALSAAISTARHG